MTDNSTQSASVTERISSLRFVFHPRTQGCRIRESMDSFASLCSSLRPDCLAYLTSGLLCTIGSAVDQPEPRRGFLTRSL